MQKKALQGMLGRMFDDADRTGGVGELQETLAKLEDENADALVIQRKKNAMRKKRSRALQEVAAEKAERRVEALADLVEKLEALAVLAETLSAEECYLVDLVSVI